MEGTCEGVPPVPADSKFTEWDYVVFSLVLAISAVIGLYYAFSGGRQKTTKEFLLADKSMSAIPVALSIFASFFSASILVGTPTEIYTQGTMYWMTVWGIMMGPVVGATIFAPFLYHLKILSAFEYFELRYKSRAVRVFGCVMIVIKNTMSMGIAMFAPAAALTEVTGIPVWASILITGFVCVFYTTLGGMKAVIWTDAFQAAIMVTGLVAPIIQGCIETGGIENAWKVAEEGERIEFFNFDPNPTVRHTFWTLIVGNFINWLPSYTVDQQLTQRYASTKSLKQATIALLLNVPGIFIMLTLSSLLGVVMYGYYAPMKCDPLTSGRVKDPNQLVPRFVMDIFTFAPGMPGLFVGALFAGALSTVSSMLNATATVVWEDIFKRFKKPREASDRTATIAAKILGIVFAAGGVGMAFVFSQVGGTVLQMTIAFNGAANAPIFGIYLLGFFFPWANWIGALAGGIPGFLFPMWVSIGAYVEKPPTLKEMPNSVECCYVASDNTTSAYYTATTDFYTVPTTPAPEVSGLDELYMLSYLWYTALGTLTTIFVGLIVSFLTGYTRTKNAQPKYLISYVDKCWCCFPESCRKHFRCGIDYSKVNSSESVSEMEDKEKSADVIFVYPDKTDISGGDEKGNAHDGSSKSVHSSEESSAKISNHSYEKSRNVGSDNNAYECLDEVEIIAKF